MLDYTRAAVTRNQSEKKINSLLAHVAASTDMRLLQARAARGAKMKASQRWGPPSCAICIAHHAVREETQCCGERR